MRITVEDPRPSPELSAALERGEILWFPRSPVPLPEEAELDFLRHGLPEKLSRKNVSLYLESHRLAGVEGKEVRERARRILAAHSAQVCAFLEGFIPELARNWTVGTSSFRPMQEKGRSLSAHASNELLHVDAGAYGATHGGRILRFFINAHPSEDRIWQTAGSFAELFSRFGAEAGVPVGPLKPSVPRRATSWTLRRLDRVFRGAKMLDSSPYDRRMRRFHNFMKDSPTFRDAPKEVLTLAFPPGSAWLVFTDTASHACLSGQFAFVDTFVVPLESCRERAAAPFHVLSGAGANAAQSSLES